MTVIINLGIIAGAVFILMALKEVDDRNKWRR